MDVLVVCENGICNGSANGMQYLDEKISGHGGIEMEIQTSEVIQNVGSISHEIRMTKNNEKLK